MDAEEKIDRKVTIPATCQMHLSGFESEDAAKSFGDKLGGYLGLISQYIDLSQIDGITVAYEYNKALNELPRGRDGLAPLTATNEKYGMGVAMTPAVLRDGVIKSHIVFNAAFVRDIENDSSGPNPDILYLLAHECGHVEDCMVRDKAFPNTILQKQHTDRREQILEQISSACWDEYAASRLSAAFESPTTLSSYEELFLGVAVEARLRANDAIKAFRTDVDVTKVIYIVAGEYGNTLKHASYLLGHLHGLGKTLDDAPNAREFIKDSWCEEFIGMLDVELASLFSCYGDWPDDSGFKKLGEIAEEIIADGGLYMIPTEDGGMDIQLPYTFETMP